MAVHHGKNQDVIGLDGIENRVGKHLRQTASDIFFKDGPTLWRFNDQLDVTRSTAAMYRNSKPGWQPA